MLSLSTIFEQSVSFDPAGDLDAFLKSVPAKWVVYLFADVDDRPVQLLCVKNLRYSLKRRLGGEETIGISKRVNYRDIVRRIYWTRVDSRFEADALYLEAARAIFPRSYEGMLGFHPAWFIHVDPAARFPRYAKTHHLAQGEGVLIGPIEDKDAAGRMMRIVEDAFDLCRYYNILVQAPKGVACAYKEMGKCPAPCDGTISMDEYREMMERSARAAVDPKEFVAEQTQLMTQAAAELRFEEAKKIKGVIGQMDALGKGAFRHAKRIEEFVFLSLQRGPREGVAKIFLVTPGRIEEIAGLICDPVHGADVIEYARELAEGRRGVAVDGAGAERVGLVSLHLFLPKQSQGVFIRLAELSEKAIGKGFRDLQKQKAQDQGDGEGVIKELQAI